MISFPTDSEVLEIDRSRRRQIRPRDRAPIQALGIVATRHSIFAQAPGNSWTPSTPGAPRFWYKYGVGLSTTDTTWTDGNAFSSVNWTKTNVTPASGQADPFGGSSAWSITETVSGTAAHSMRHTFTNQGVNALMKITFWAKPNGRNWVWVGDNTTDRIFFNLASGTVGSTPGANTRYPSITAAGNGFYQCSYYTKVSNSNLDFGLANADNSTSYVGDGTSGVILYNVSLYQRRVSQWNDQSGNGLNVTQGTDSTRPFYEIGQGVVCIRDAQQYLTVASGGPSQTSNHSIFVLARFDVAAAAFQGLVAIGSGASATSTVGSNGSNQTWFGGHGLTGPVGTVLSAGTRYRIGKVVTGGSTQGYLNGVVDGAPASNAYDAGSTSIHIGNYNAVGTNVGNWSIIEAIGYNFALGNSDIANMDSYLSALAASL